MSAKPKNLSLLGLLEAATVALCIGGGLAFLARLWWVFELACHFRPHQAVLLWLAAGFWFWMNRRWLAGFCGALALLNTLMVAALFLPPSTGPLPGSQKLRLLSLNVHTSNKRMDQALDYLRQSDADIILLMEVNDRWMNSLSALNESYPFRIAAPREDNFGIALFSRLPLTNSNVVEIGGAEVPSITIEAEWPGGQFFLLGTHPLPPGSAAYAAWRNEQLQAVATLVRTQALPVIVVGDLNLTPWSPYFSALLKQSGLKNTSQGLGLFNSWPGALACMGIPIDHCFVSQDWTVLAKRAGPPLGSDHLPVLVEISLPPKESK